VGRGKGLELRIGKVIVKASVDPGRRGGDGREREDGREEGVDLEQRVRNEIVDNWKEVVL
jgi:hypothetical protein